MLALLVALVATALVPSEAAQAGRSAALKPGVKVFVHSMPNDFHTFLRAAITKKKVPVDVVATREEAEFEIKGTSESQKAGAAKKIFMGSWHSDEEASISVTSVESGEIVFAYSVNKRNSARGRQSAAEACAKHLKEALEKTK